MSQSRVRDDVAQVEVSNFGIVDDRLSTVIHSVFSQCSDKTAPTGRAMKRSCARCLIQAGRVFEVAPAPSRLVVRPLSTSITLLANDRGPSRRPQMTTRDPTSMQRVVKSSIQNTTTEKPIASESKVDYPELPNEQFVESWTVSFQRGTGRDDAETSLLVFPK